jgi:hypothetical protein
MLADKCVDPTSNTASAVSPSFPVVATIFNTSLSNGRWSRLTHLAALGVLGILSLG